VPERFIRQPGTPGARRIASVPAGAIPIEAELPAGGLLLDTLAELVARHGAESACLALGGGGFGPFGYVIPALSPDASHAAFYSAPSRPPGVTRLDAAAITVGWRDGKPFFHCHALWTEADGTRGCGHVLPEETVIAVPIHATGAALIGARFDAAQDEETGFRLFSPVATGTALPARAIPGVALRLAPNQDLVRTLEKAAAEARLGRAAVRGGVASTIGARFADAPPIEGFATELLVTRGIVGEASALDIAIVDLEGHIGQGRVLAGDNPVLMTFEGFLEAI
jgi:predicted DNA-binding protein with PD1-like motif